MKRRVSRSLGLVAAAGVLGSAMLGQPAGAAAPGTAKSPTTSVDPYVIPSADGVSITSMLTVGDTTTAYNGYKMVGIPDGLGAYKRDSDGRIVINMNHELRDSVGITRAHGQKGGFVSQYVVNPGDLSVRTGKDLNKTVRYFDYGTGTFTAAVPAGELAAFNRFCSGTTVAKGQLYNPVTGNGTMEPIHFAGEESGREGRAFGTLPNGVTKQLPRLGRMSWENAVPASNATDRTVVMGLDDTNPGWLGMYVGAKKTGGDAFYNAGLTNGKLFGIWLNGSVATTDAQFRTNVGTGTPVQFFPRDLNWNQSGANQYNEVVADQSMLFNRIEDGHFDPNNPNDFYFLTTDGGEGAGEGGGGGLWRLRFVDVENPALGGTLELLLDGTESITLNKPDNMVIDGYGNLLIQEDPGGVPAVARILAYRISDGALGEVATFDPALFDPAVAGANLLTQDEESSGIIDAEELLGTGWFFFDAQVHTSTGLPAGTGAGTVQEFVERGQLLAMRVQDWAKVYGP